RSCTNRGTTSVTAIESWTKVPTPNSCWWGTPVASRTGRASRAEKKTWCRGSNRRTSVSRSARCGSARSPSSNDVQPVCPCVCVTSWTHSTSGLIWGSHAANCPYIAPPHALIDTSRTASPLPRARLVEVRVRGDAGDAQARRDRLDRLAHLRRPLPIESLHHGDLVFPGHPGDRLADLVDRLGDHGVHHGDEVLPDVLVGLGGGCPGRWQQPVEDAARLLQSAQFDVYAQRRDDVARLVAEVHRRAAQLAPVAGEP